MEGPLIVASTTLALLTGIFGWRALVDLRQANQYRRLLVSGDAEGSKRVDEAMGGESAFDAKVIAMMSGFGMRDGMQGAFASGGSVGIRVLDGSIPWLRPISSSKWFCAHVDRTGLEGRISEGGFCSTRIRLTLTFGAVAAVIGAIFSGELCAVMLIVGCVLGWRAPKRALEHRIEGRTYQMEHHLPEMLDVIALGMRSGLSFDASIRLYTSHFKTYLARELSNAQKQWLSGLEHRDEALRRIARSYDSQIFRRIIETIIRSVRFGSSMVESLEEQSAEARLTYRTRREEQVAKAPVKMMIPTGTLILPAMLIMVVGPVLLELMGGGL